MAIIEVIGGKPAREFDTYYEAQLEWARRSENLRRRHGRKMAPTIEIRLHTGGWHLYRPLEGTTLCVDGKWRHRVLEGTVED